MDSIEVLNHRKFVDSVTSEATKDCDTFIERLDELKIIQSGMNLKGYSLVQSVFVLKVENY